MISLRDAIAALVGCGCFLGAFSLRGAQSIRYDRARRVLDVAQIPSPTVSRLVSLGHTEWMADLLWINATLYYSDTLYARLPSRYLRRYTATMSAVDPRFRPAYLWGALALVYRTTRVTADDVRDAIAVLREGIARFPDDPELRGQLGIYLAFELAPRLRAGTPEFQRARRDAGEALGQACDAGWGPPWMPLAAANFLIEAERHRDALALLQGALVRTVDASIRQRIEARIEAIQRAHPEENDLTESLRALDESRAQDIPWATPTQFVFFGPSPLHRAGVRLDVGHSSARLR